MNYNVPTVRRQVLGEELRILRTGTDFSLEQASRVIDASPSKLSRIETGHRNAPIEDIASLLALYRADSGQRARLLALSREADEIGWLQSHKPVSGQRQHTLTTLESKAEQIVYVNPVVIPELLRTAEYARALRAESVATSNSDVEDHTVTLLPRRSFLTRRQSPQLIAIVDESVLLRQLGATDVVRRQLEHLHDAVTQNHWTIRVVPGETSVTTGAFTLLRTPDRSPVIHIEYLTCSLFLERPHDIDAYEKTLTRLDENALDKAGSLDLIAHAARSLEPQTRDDP